MTTLLVVFALCGIALSSSDIKISLNGNDWQLTNGSSMTAISASVPGEVYIPLMNAGILDNPYYGMQPMIDQWVAKSDWIYTKTINIDQSTKLLDYRVIQLIADGIDSKANISINGKLVFTNDNMFHRNVINIKSFLQYGSSKITIYLYNKVEWTQQEHGSCNTQQDGQCPGSSQNHNGFTYVNYIRTEPCSFSWDWGPAYSPVGIWKGMEIQAYNDAVVRDFMIYATPKNNSDYIHVQDIKNKNDMTEDEWLIYNAFRNKEKGLKDYTSWDTKVVVYVDSGANNVLNPANNEILTNKRRMQSNSIKGTLKVSIPSLTSQTFTMNISLPINTEMNFTVSMSLNNMQ